MRVSLSMRSWVRPRPRLLSRVTLAASPSAPGLDPGVVQGCLFAGNFNTSAIVSVSQIVEAGPDREKDGVVRWRRLDLKRVIAERFGVDFHPRCVGKLLKKLGFSHISARPRHPAQDERTVEAFKKTSRAR